MLGAAGAFFFRNDTTPNAETPRLRNGRQLDARIAEKSVTPYLQGIEEDDDKPRGTAARGVSDRGGPPLFQGNDRALPRLDSPDFLSDDTSDPFDNPHQTGRSPRAELDVEDGVPDLAPIPIPDNHEIVGDRNSTPRDETSAAAPEQVHIVQKGETLSSIAARELGSTNRFIELFEANRDQLKDANDVRIGMKLRLPARAMAKSTRPSPARSKHDLLNDSAPPLLDSRQSPHDERGLPPITDLENPSSKSSLPNKPGVEPKKFVAPKRLPLGTRLPGPQTDAGDSKVQAGRRLSQLPPDELGGKVAR